jgi:copper homeostasis protein CutC
MHKTRNFYQKFNFGSLRMYQGGDFLYDENEIEIMAQDCEIFANSGANGLVFGCLDKNAEIDVLG